MAAMGLTRPDVSSGGDRHVSSFDIGHYQEMGWAVAPGLFGQEECAEFIDHMMALQAGAKRLEGFVPRAPDEWGRTHNQHRYDDKAQQWLIAPPLLNPLRQILDDEPEGIQTMYFWVGSEQGRHQDQYYLPGCMSAWIALMDVDEDNGTIWVQSRSHKKRLLTKDDFADNGEFDAWDYNKAVDKIFDQNGLPEEAVRVRRGDVVFFDGALIHRGGPVGQPGSFRHVLANHYIAGDFTDWPHTSWPRVAFDGSQRF
jgi:hypothetical protein